MPDGEVSIIQKRRNVEIAVMFLELMDTCFMMIIFSIIPVHLNTHCMSAVLFNKT